MTELRRQRCGCWYTVVDACREERKPVGMGVEPMDVAGDRCARARNLPSTYAIQCCSAGCAACQAAVSCGAEQNASGPRGRTARCIGFPRCRPFMQWHQPSDQSNHVLLIVPLCTYASDRSMLAHALRSRRC